VIKPRFEAMTILLSAYHPRKMGKILAVEAFADGGIADARPICKIKLDC
jgi:hypothetical protein